MPFADSTQPSMVFCLGMTRYTTSTTPTAQTTIQPLIPVKLGKSQLFEELICATAGREATDSDAHRRSPAQNFDDMTLAPSRSTISTLRAIDLATTVPPCADKTMLFCN